MLSSTEDHTLSIRKSSRPRNIPSKLSNSTNLSNHSDNDRDIVDCDNSMHTSTIDINGFSLFQQWSSPGCALKLALDEWVALWDKNAEFSCISLLNAILCASDILPSTSPTDHFHLTVNDYNHGDPAVLLNELQSNWKDNLTAAPSKTHAVAAKQHKILRVSIKEFFLKWTSSFWTSHSDDCKTFLTWLMTMSSSGYRQLRYISTLISFTILQASARATIEFGIELDQNSKISTAKSASLARGSGRTVDILTSQIACMESIVQMLFDGVFVQRFRDIDHSIRELSIQSLGDWILSLDEVFLENCYLRYLGWSLSDREHTVRATSLRSLQLLYSKVSVVWKEGLLAFNSRFKVRILEMASRDIDSTVRKEAMILLTNALASSLNDTSDSSIPSLITSQDCEPIITSILSQSFINYQNNFGSKPTGAKGNHSIRSSNYNLLNRESISLLVLTLFDGLSLQQSRDRYSLLLQQLQPENRGPLLKAEAPLIIRFLSFIEPVLDLFKTLEEKMLFSEFLFRDSTFKATFGSLFKDAKKIFDFYYALFDPSTNEYTCNSSWNMALESSKGSIVLKKENALLLISASIRQITLLPLDSFGRKSICLKLENNIHSKVLATVLEGTTFLEDTISSLTQEQPNALLIASMFQLLLYCNFDSIDSLKLDLSCLKDFFSVLFPSITTSTCSTSRTKLITSQDAKTVTNLISSFLLKNEMHSITSSLLSDLSNPLHDSNVALVTLLSKWCSGTEENCLCASILPSASQSFIEHCEVFISTLPEDYEEDSCIEDLMSLLLILSKHTHSFGDVILSSNIIVSFISKLMSFDSSTTTTTTTILPSQLTLKTLNLIDSLLSSSGDKISANQRHVIGSSICLLVHHSLASKLLISSSSSEIGQNQAYPILFMAVRMFLKFDVSDENEPNNMLFTPNQLSEFYRWTPMVAKDTSSPDSSLALDLLKNTLFSSAIERYPFFLERILESIWEALASEPEGCEGEFLDIFYKNTLSQWITEYPKEIFSCSLHQHLIEHCSLKHSSSGVAFQNGDELSSSSARWSTMYHSFMDHTLAPLVPLLDDDDGDNDLDTCLSLLKRSSISSSIVPPPAYHRLLEQRTKRTMRKQMSSIHQLHYNIQSSPNPFNSQTAISSLPLSSPLPIEGLSELAIDSTNQQEQNLQQQNSPIGRPKRKRSINY